MRLTWALGAIFLSGLAVQGASVTVNLGQSSQDWMETGTGAKAGGYGTYVVTNGACTPGQSSTTCLISGSFTGSTAGFTGGTYSLVTTYAGTGQSPLLGVSTTPGGNFFTYYYIPSTTTIDLMLTESGGVQQIEPIFAGGKFVGGFSVRYASETCVGLPSGVPCSPGNVGLNAGSSVSGPVTGSATFNIANPTTVPEPQVAWLSLILIPAFWLKKRVLS